MSGHATLPSEVEPRDLGELITDSLALPRTAPTEPAPPVDLAALHVDGVQIDQGTLALLEGMSDYGD